MGTGSNDVPQRCFRLGGAPIQRAPRPGSALPRRQAIKQRQAVKRRHLRAGLDHVTVSEIKRCDLQAISTDGAKKLARTLGVSVDYLIDTWDEDEAAAAQAVIHIGAPRRRSRAS